MNEKRRLERKDVDQFIRVNDAIHGVELGRIVNLSEDGFMLISGTDLKESCLYQLVLILNEEVDGVSEIPIGAECLWINEMDFGDQHWVGFHIMDVSDENLELIKLLAH
ncbi:MAG: PilZ domain-containing protein [Agarilytica sp.]